MAELTANTNVIYCASRNSYDEQPLRGVDAFKTLEEGQIYSGMRLKSAKTGRAGHLSLHTMKAVSA